MSVLFLSWAKIGRRDAECVQSSAVMDLPIEFNPSAWPMAKAAEQWKSTAAQTPAMTSQRLDPILLEHFLSYQAPLHSSLHPSCNVMILRKVLLSLIFKIGHASVLRNVQTV
jgi:hypothetical protein